MKSWKDIGFEIEITADQSPTLRLLKPNYPDATHGESMHHSGGACAETNLIYGNPIRDIVQKIENPSFLIVGLGLGYIEMVIAREALLAGRSVAKITSFESVPELREFFFAWIHGKLEVLSDEVQQTYQHVCDCVLQGTSLKTSDVQNFLKDHFKSLSDIEGELLEESTLTLRYHCILYDAFSSKTTPHLWSEEFLTKVLKQGAQERCAFSTYACRVSLKKSLADEGFEVIVRPGFQGKRNSTLGLRSLS